MNIPLIEPLEARIAPATFSIATPGPINEGHTGTTDLVFLVTLSEALASDATVNFTTVNGTVAATQATIADNDYTLTSGTLTFTPGETVKEIRVPIIGDSKHEADEIFTLQLSQPSEGHTILAGASVATGTILNDDPVPTVSIGNVTILEGDLGTKTATFEVTLSNRSSSIISLRVSTVDGTATAGVDYVAVTQPITFLATNPNLTRTVAVTINGDTTPEADETFTVVLSDPQNVTLGDAEATGTITNDDFLPVIAISSSTLNVETVEGDAGSKLINFTVTLSKAFTEPVTVTAATTGTTASAGSDFTAVSQLLTFAPGETTKTVSVPILGDLDDESDESFFLNLTNPSANAELGASQAVGTIRNDEVQVSVADVSVLETNGDTTLTFNVSLSKAANHPVTVNFATQDGTAVSSGDGADFDARTGVLTFDPGQTLLPVSIVIRGDSVGELDETFLLKLTGSSGAVIGRNTATGTILNDETTLSISDAQVLEGGANGVTQAVFTVTLANPPATGNVTVNAGTEDGTATVAGTDYTALLATANTLTFLPGETTKQVFVAVNGDSAIEPNETFSVKLSGASSNVSIARGTGTGTILNDDGAALTISDVTVTEGDGGTTNAQFLVRLLNAATQTVTVDVTTEAGTASTDDFTPFSPATRTLTFTAGQFQQFVTVPIVGDLIREGTETFSVRLANATGSATIAKAVGIGTILDNNDPAPTVSVGNASLVEGNVGTSLMQFTATLSQPSVSTVTVNYSTRNISATAGLDYTPVSGTATFAPGQTSAQILVPILGDALDEGDETFGVVLSAPSGAGIGTAEGIGTIQNDEVSVNIGDVAIFERTGGTTTYFFEISLSKSGGGALLNPVTVNFATQDGTAISTGANADFTAASGTRTFTPGGSLSQVVEVTVVGDARLENDEQFFVNLVSSVNAAIVDGQGVGTILNDDVARISIADPEPFTEGNTGTGDMIFTVSLDQASDLPVTVTVNTVNGTAVAVTDFTPIAAQTLTFNPGETSKTVTVKVVGDLTDETRNETFSVQLSGQTPAGATLLRANATGTIVDNDLRTLSVSDVSIVEGDFGTSAATFTVQLSAVSTQVVSFTYGTADGTALAGQDYVAASGTGTIAAGQTSGQVTVLINGDTASEVNENFFLNLLTSPNANISTTASQAKATIVDDEVGGARLELVPVSGVEFDEANRVVEFNVVRTGSLTSAASVQYETVDGTARSFGSVADFVAKAGTISFAAGSATASERIRIQINGDVNFEDAESFQIRLFNPVNAAVLDGNGDVAAGSLTEITIREDLADLEPTLSIADLRIVEGNTGSQQVAFKVRLLNADGLPASNEKQTVSVRATTAPGNDPATSANSVAATPLRLQDYVATESGGRLITFNPGDTEKDFLVTVNGDVRDELDEEFFRVLLSDANTTVSRGEALGTIADDDLAPTVQFASSAITVIEGDTGVTNAVLTLTLSQASELPVKVRFTTQNGTAVSGVNGDFEAVDRVVSFSLGDASSSQTVTVLVNSDTITEGTESFGVTISEAENAQIVGGSAQATVTITDNDPNPVISVTGGDVIEGDSGTRDLVFKVSLSSPSARTVEVNFNTKDGTATSTGALADFVAQTGKVTFAPGETEQEVRILVKGDTYREQNETFTLELSTPVNGTILSTSAAGTILTDGDSIVGITIRDAFGVEGNFGTSPFTFTVELSDVLPTLTTFNAVATSGTATAGTDFLPITDTSNLRFLPNTRSATVTVTVNGDGLFEPTENFSVELASVASEGTTFEIVGGIARGTIFNDDIRVVNSRTIQYIDEDGDLATLRISKGTLSVDRLKFAQQGTVGGRQLQEINLIGNNAQFQNANLSVTAVAQPGFTGDANGKLGDGLVNVGSILAAVPDSSILQFLNGIDFGTVRIGGDLGKIVAGDNLASSAIENLVVRSLGSLGTSTQGTASGLNTVSVVLGPIDTLHVRGDFEGTLLVVGGRFGDIHNLRIDGALRGGSEANSGQIFFTGSIDNARIGRIVGGSGADSGVIVGTTNLLTNIGSIRVIDDVTGGSGARSGGFSALTIGTVKLGSLEGGAGVSSGRVLSFRSIGSVSVAGDVVGGAGADSGEIFARGSIGAVKVNGKIQGGAGESSGFIGSDVRIGNFTALDGVFGGTGKDSGSIQTGSTISLVRTGSIVGGAGENSGTILAGGSVGKLKVLGDVLGGSGKGSGGIDVGGRLASGLITGDVVGGISSATTNLEKSGYVIAQRIDKLTLIGNLEAGTNGGQPVAMSGTIRSETTLGSLHIRGNVVGNEGVAAIIAAPGSAGATAIKSLKIDGNARFAEILGGYAANGTVANPRGTAINADAQIGTVSIGGTVQETSIIAGVSAGADGRFGTSDDVLIGGTGTVNAPRALSKIAKIIVGGNVLAGVESYGIVAQQVQSLSVRGSAFSLNPGAGNDLAPGRELVPGSKIRVFEVAVV